MSTPEKALGDVVVARTKDVKLDTRAKSAGKGFAGTHAKYSAGCEATKALEFGRRDALATIGAADELLDPATGKLADTLIGAGLTKRGKPLGEFSSYSVTTICALGYARQVEASTKLTRAIRKAKPGREVIAACEVVEGHVATLKRALAALDAPHKRWQRSIKERDAALLDWQKALTRFRILARASLIDDAPAFQALFAEPEGITVATRKRRK